MPPRTKYTRASPIQLRRWLFPALLVYSSRLMASRLRAIFSCKASQRNQRNLLYQKRALSLTRIATTTGGDQSPPLDTKDIGGYQVLKIAPLIGSKLGWAEEKNYADVLWLIQNKGNDVKDAADDIDMQKRVEFASSYRDDGNDIEDILEAFRLSEDDIEGADEDSDD